MNFCSSLLKVSAYVAPRSAYYCPVLNQGCTLFHSTDPCSKKNCILILWQVWACFRLMMRAITVKLKRDGIPLRLPILVINILLCALFKICQLAHSLLTNTLFTCSGRYFKKYIYTSAGVPFVLWSCCKICRIGHIEIKAQPHYLFVFIHNMEHF